MKKSENFKKNNQKSPLRWAFAAVRRQSGIIVLLVILSSLVASTGTVAALISKFVVDNALAEDMNAFAVFAALLVSLYLVSVVLKAVNKYLTEKCRITIETDIKSRLFAAIMGKRFDKISNLHSGDMLNLLTSDTAVISHAAATLLPSVVSQIVRLVFAVVVITSLEPLFALIFVIGGIFVFIVTKIMRAKFKELHKRVKEEDGKARSFWQEALSNLLIVKVFSTEKKTRQKGDELQMNTLGAVMKKTKFSSITGAGYNAVMYIGYSLAFLWCCFRLIIDATFTYGSFTAIMQLVGQLQHPFSSMSGLIPRYYGAIASCERIMEIEAIGDENKGDMVIEPASLYENMESLRFEGVNFAYNNEQILKDFNCEINKGDFVAVVGDSGAGKSTLFKIMLSVYNTQSGSVYFKTKTGEQVACNSSARKMFSYVPQGNLLFSGTIRENITFANEKATETEIHHALKIAAADEFVAELPQGLETVIGEKGFGLSEGQIQRLAIARAYLSRAPILMLDEATSALDADTEKKVLNNIRDIKDLTCIIVTHRKAAAEICDRKIEVEKFE